MKEVWVTLWSNAAYRDLLFCHAVGFFFGYGILQWQPAFFIRSNGLETGKLGTWLALIGLAAGLAVYLGEAIAARYAAGD